MTNLESEIAKVFVNMTDEEIQYKMCVKQGWIQIENTRGREFEEHYLAWIYPDTSRLVHRIPYWVGNMSDIYELEKYIPENERGGYTYCLAIILGLDIGMVNDWYLVHASPRQRCLAWLMWQETV